MTWIFGNEPTAEQKAEYERQRMRNQEIIMRMKRLFAEMEPDGLEVIHACFAHIANAGSPRAIANWYEGVTASALFVRDIRLNETGSFSAAATDELFSAPKFGETASPIDGGVFTDTDEFDDDDPDDVA